MKENITIKGAKEHNLKNIDLEIPRNKMTVFTGISGSGKSSLAFDTIFAEGQRRYVESLSTYARQFLSKMNKPEVDEIEGLSPAVSIDQKAHSHNPRSTVATITEIYDFLRVIFARLGKPFCPICGKEIHPMSVDEIVDAIISIKKGEQITVMAPVVKGRKGEYYQLLYDLLNDGFRKVRIDGEFRSLRERTIIYKHKKHNISVVVDEIPLSAPLKDIRSRIAEATEMSLKRGGGSMEVIIEGKEYIFSEKFSCPRDNFSYPGIEPRLFSFNSPYGACKECNGTGREGIYSQKICPSCKGKRLRKEALSVLLLDKNICEITALPISQGVLFFDSLEGMLKESEREIARAPLREIKERMKFLFNIGLGYLSLDRATHTLSGGEAQRIRLASQMGTRLVGTLYILDEPTIGLHQEDNAKLIETLRSLRDLGNTIIVVEHDEDTIFASDYLVDFGPGAGSEGGKIVASGDFPQILEDRKKDSLTLRYLRGEEKIPIPKKRRGVNAGTPFLKVRGASEHNLKNINVDFPLRRLISVTGVSGSGKSTLVYDVLYKHLSALIGGSKKRVGKVKQIIGTEYVDKVVSIDQSPIGRTPRSTPATYVGVFTDIRELFSYSEEARMRGWQPGRFSFNVGGGRCENCKGYGYIAVEMHFLPTVYVTCDICEGKRYNRETLEINYRGKNIYEVLSMTVDDALILFKDTPWIKKKLGILSDVGLGYLTLGQSAVTLSGGEAQRIKLSSELSKPDTRNTLYVFDEPTVGLHYDDVKKLIYVLNRLVDRGNTVIVIEHNMDIIKCSDHIIDLGPGGGDEGGNVVAFGTPETVSKKGSSLTGKHLKKVL